MLLHYKTQNKNGDIDPSSKSSEFYEGFKTGKKTKLYNLIFLIRRIAIAMCLVCFRNFTISTRVMAFVLIQILYFYYLVQTKPHEEEKDNTVDILNETIFITLTVIIGLLQTEDDWKPGMSQVLIGAVMASGLII